VQITGASFNAVQAEDVSENLFVWLCSGGLQDEVADLDL